LHLHRFVARQTLGTMLHAQALGTLLHAEHDAQTMPALGMIPCEPVPGLAMPALGSRYGVTYGASAPASFRAAT
jgi:hypothetical protein